MTLQELWAILHESVLKPAAVPVIIIALMSLVEVSKIQINPWSWLGGIIGKLIGIKALSDKVDVLEMKIGENQATAIRVRILHFEDEIQNGRKYSKDSWDQVMDDIERYETYTREHPEFKNNITVASVTHLKKLYGKLLEKRAWTTTLSQEENK